MKRSRQEEEARRDAVECNSIDEEDSSGKGKPAAVMRTRCQSHLLIGIRQLFIDILSTINHKYNNSFNRIFEFIHFCSRGQFISRCRLSSAIIYIG